ncbi:MAG: EF-P beta-lysylation protein EpmB [Deltaproteobacteria bacterium]|nr:EF-P beta-lysylation protein EpmB [Deltaproteobacteria bacterium]
MLAHYPNPERPSWQHALARAIRDPQDLLDELELSHELLPAARRAAARFPLVVPRGFVARMRRGDPSDPLLRQVLPLDDELTELPGFSPDPVHDLKAEVAPGVLHKYPGRVLLITTGACGVHCRYCFRREFPYETSSTENSTWREATTYISGDPSIREVILSGGDPLSLSDRRLGLLFEALGSIPHVERIRIHTRQPIVLPERVDTGLIATLGQRPPSFALVVVIHANHAQEIDERVAIALGQLRQAGAMLLNQAVLLRGVNDTEEALVALSESLARVGVLPYYLNVLDRVRGSAHFEVDEARGLELMAALRARLPGYLVPRLVSDRPGNSSKTILSE